MRILPRAAAIAAVALVIFGQRRSRRTIPTRTVSLVVPYPPGGGVDAMARVVAEKLAGALGQQVVVENRAGGSGLVGTRTFIKSPPDGYTLFLGHTGSISINPSLYANAGFDPRKDFAPIGLIASMPVALACASLVPGQDDRRRGRDREGGGSQVQHRNVGGRHRRLSHRRIVQVGHRHRRRHHPLQGHRRRS